MGAGNFLEDETKALDESRHPGEIYLFILPDIGMIVAFFFLIPYVFFLFGVSREKLATNNSPKQMCPLQEASSSLETDSIFM